MVFSPRDLKYFDVAKSLSLLSDHYKAKIGCVIVHRHDVISTGINLMKSHPIQLKYNMFRGFKEEDCRHNLHAEMSALIKCKREIPKGSKIYIYRSKKTGESGLARPCKACMQALRNNGIFDIYYSNDDFGLVYEHLTQ